MWIDPFSKGITPPSTAVNSGDIGILFALNIGVFGYSFRMAVMDLGDNYHQQAQAFFGHQNTPILHRNILRFFIDIYHL